MSTSTSGGTASTDRITRSMAKQKNSAEVTGGVDANHHVEDHHQHVPEANQHLQGNLEIDEDSVDSINQLERDVNTAPISRSESPVILADSPSDRVARDTDDVNDQHVTVDGGPKEDYAALSPLADPQSQAAAAALLTLHNSPPAPTTPTVSPPPHRMDQGMQRD